MISKIRRIVLVTLLLLTGCAASYRQQHMGHVVHLDPMKRVYVALPADGGYSTRVAAGSGQLTAQGLATALSRADIDVRLAQTVETGEQLLLSAQAAGATYIADAKIANWEQRSTAWSGRPSRLSISVRMLDAKTGEVLDSAILESRSRVMSLMSTSPESLLKGATSAYVTRVFLMPPPVAPPRP